YRPVLCIRPPSQLLDRERQHPVVEPRLTGFHLHQTFPQIDPRAVLEARFGFIAPCYSCLTRSEYGRRGPRVVTLACRNGDRMVIPINILESATCGLLPGDGIAPVTGTAFVFAADGPPHRLMLQAAPPLAQFLDLN